MQRKNYSLFILFICLMQFAAQPALSQALSIEFLSETSYEFEKIINFQGKITPSLPIQRAYLLIKANKTETIKIPIDIDKEQRFTQSFDLSSNPILPFSIIEYWVEVERIDGTTLISPTKELRYLDNRQGWKTTSLDPFLIHFKGERLTVENTVIPILRQAIQKIQTILPASSIPPVDIYIYNSPGDLREAYPLSQANWMAAHVEPQSQVILLSLSTTADQIVGLKQQIPHELMHILLWQLSPEAYKQLPVWLNEGLATSAELSPNAEYATILQNAVHNHSLINFNNLCNSFPQDISNIYLAYAQSGDFVQFLIHSYGSQKIISLINAYQNPSDCVTPLQITYGLTLNDLTQKWLKEQFGIISLDFVFNNFAPWLAVLAIILLTPFLLSSTLFHHHRHSQEEP
ncbi:MAG: peptidase MA family metallohydrolase [Anaerolineales bacterium]